MEFYLLYTSSWVYDHTSVIVDPGTGGVLSCVLVTEPTLRNETQKQETEEQEQSQINKSRKTRVTQRDNQRKKYPRKNNFSTNPGNFSEHYIFLTQNRGYVLNTRTRSSTLAAESSLHTGCNEYTPAFDYSVICLRARTESPNMPAFETLTCTALTGGMRA